MSALRVIHLRSSVGLYGAEQMLLDLCAEQQRRGLLTRITAFQPPSAGVPALLGAAATRGLTSNGLQCSGVLDPACVSALRTQLVEASQQRDLVLHCHDYKSVCYGAVAARGLRLRRVATAHGWVRGGVRLRLYRALEMRMLRGFDRVCAVSPPIAQELQQAGIAARRICQIDNGIDMQRYRLGGSLPSSNTLQLGTAARLAPEKNLQQLLLALAQCRSFGLRFALTVYGEGELREELEGLVARLDLGDCVSLPGASGTLEQWYVQLDAFVLVSLSEGMPLTVLEALACGCPVLASNVGALPSMLADLPGCRVLPAGNYAALVDALCTQPRRTQADPSLRQRVSDRYALTRMADAYDQVYREALTA